MKNNHFNFWHYAVLFTFCLLVMLLTTAAVPTSNSAKPYTTGSVCNYSSKNVAILLQTGSNVKKSYQIKALTAGACETENVFALFGKTCSDKSNCLAQIVELNNGGAIVIDSVRKNSLANMTTLAVIPTSPKVTVVKDITRPNFTLTKDEIFSTFRFLGYSLDLDRPIFRSPLTGMQEGIDFTKQRSEAHENADYYALDYIFTGSTARSNVDIYPVLPGRVVFSGYDRDYGCTVVIRSHNPKNWSAIYYTLYAHMKEYNPDTHECQGPAKGQVIDGKQPIGGMSASGTGGNQVYHLHLSMRISNKEYEGTDALYGRKPGLYPFDVRLMLR